MFLEQLPIVKADKTAQRKLEDFVERIQHAKKQHDDATALEQKIDLIVDALYGLTYEEVRVVDPDFGLSREEYSRATRSVAAH